MNKTPLTYEQYWRLYKSSQIKKYGHLESWKEICIYVYQFATPAQTKEIQEWANRKNMGEDIRLPLMNNGHQEALI